MNRILITAIACMALLGSSCHHQYTGASTPKQGETAAQFAKDQWRPMTESEGEAAWGYIHNSPLGIAGLNQLAIEGFISPTCPKTFYSNDRYGGMQFLLRVKCPNPRGVSTAIAYDEMRIIYNRFESNIEGFDIERVGAENRDRVRPLPD